jgi:hypothetical protein
MSWAPDQDLESEGAFETSPVELSRAKYLALLGNLRADLQREVDEVEELVERLRAAGEESCPREVALLEKLVEEQLAPALRQVCTIEERAFLRRRPGTRRSADRQA